MKRFLALFLVIGILLAGCTTQEDNTGTLPPLYQDPDAQPDIPQQETELAAVSVPMTIERSYSDDGTELFFYAYQHMNLILPDVEVADRIILDFLNRVDATQAESENILASAAMQYDASSDWYPYFYKIVYSPTRIDHGILSLFGTQSSFSGGMHGHTSGIAVNYDIQTGDILTLGSIMHKDATKEAFIELVIAKLLDAAESYCLYDDFEEGVWDRFSIDENLYKDFYFTASGLCFFFSPYEIAPYASGIITVELSYSELPGLIYDGYFPPEQEQTNGSMRSGLCMDTDMSQFSNMAEVTLSDADMLYVVYAEDRVRDIQVTVTGDYKNVPDYTVFSAYEMSDRDAIVINTSMETAKKIVIRYFSGSDYKEMVLCN